MTFNMKNTILLGYGNPDRGDDGVAWHFLQKLVSKFEAEDVDLLTSDIIRISDSIDIWFNLQLLPELSEAIANYERAIFIDAHTGEIQKDINLQRVEPKYTSSPFTHHMTPSTVLSLTNSFGGKCPDSWLLSIRGYEFNFERSLTERTSKLISEALLLFEERFLE